MEVLSLFFFLSFHYVYVHEGVNLCMYVFFSVYYNADNESIIKMKLCQ